MKTGFTLVELLLSVAIIAILMSVMLPVFYGFRTRHDLDIAAESVAVSLRRAQALSQGVEGDSSWGVHIATGTVMLFRGSSFASRTVAEDESFAITDTITPSGTLDFVFERFTGFAQAAGTTTLIAVTGENRAIGVTVRGAIFY